jgi:hypothetical protein
VISPAQPLPGGSAATLSTPEWSPEISLRGRVLALRQRRLALRLRDWLGVGVIAAFSLTLCAVTLFSLLGR